MKILLEDKQSDLLSSLIVRAIGSTGAHNVIFTEGAGNLVTIAGQLCANGEEMVIALPDVIPDNRVTVQTYSKLRRMYWAYSRRIVTLPVVCSAHYFIRSVADASVVVDTTGLSECYHVYSWRGSSLVSTEADIRYVKNFEKFCKLFTIKCLSDCARHSRGFDTVNTLYGRYYSSDCPCDTLCASYPKSLSEKATGFAEMFPINLATFAELTNAECAHRTLLELNRKLCEWHNSKIAEFGTENLCGYLRPIVEVATNITQVDKHGSGFTRMKLE